MALERFNEDLNFVTNLGDNPRRDDGLSTPQFKSIFDKAGLAIQNFINNKLIPGIEDAVTETGLLGQFSEALNKKLSLSGGTMTGGINMGGQKLNGLNAPTSNDEAATMGFVNQEVRNAAPFNYAVNSDFEHFIAQAGIGGIHEPGTPTVYYAGDRWILDSGTVTGDAREDGNGYTNITLNGTIRQIVANAPDVGTAAIEMVSGTADILYTDGVIVINSNGGVIKNVRLFRGAYTADNMPKHQPKGYGVELAECQRYFIRYSASQEVIFLMCGVSSSRIYGTLLLPVNMRVVPSLTYHNVNVYPYTSGDSIAINGFTITGKTKENNALYLRCTLASSPEKQIAAIRILNDGYIDLSADFPED